MHDERYEEKDTAVSSWLARQGWPVTDRHRDPSSEVRAWRSEAVRPSITLRITRNVVDDYTADELVRHLDRFRVAQVLSRAPEKYTVLRTSDAGPPELVQLDAPPQASAH
jgi:hypothetical protein